MNKLLLKTIQIQYNNKNFYLSRNEFNKCIDESGKYFVYLWNNEDQEEPYIYNDEDILANTPKDQGGSTWKTTFIKFDD